MGGCQQYAPCALAEHVLETSVGSLKGWSEKWGRGACKQVRLWEAKDAARWAGEGAEAPSKGLSWTWHLPAVAARLCGFLATLFVRVLFRLIRSGWHLRC